MESTFDISSETLPQIIQPEDIFVINVQKKTDPEPPSEKYGYDSSLNKYRDFIDNIKSEDWKKVRWYINKYDFLVKDPIINRAFYKYWEIVNEFEIFENYQDKDLILHCAEAPGGFIQGTNIYLQVDRIPDPVQPTFLKQITDDDGFVTVNKKPRKAKNDYRIYTISLNKDLPQYKSYNLPTYNKNVMNKHVCVTYGKDYTGDINNWDNVDYIKTLAKNLFFLITADGGFDEGTDFNNKEQLHYCLILSEIYTGLALQAHDGHFVLKVFDVFTETSVHLLYLLTLCYKGVFIYKPKTSRPTNSEKYIICKNFHLNEESKNVILSVLRNVQHKLKKQKSRYTSFTIFKSIPQEFIDKVCHMNKSLLANQCDFLQKAIELCNQPDFIQNYDFNLQDSLEQRKSVFHEWGKHYNLNSYV